MTEKKKQKKDRTPAEIAEYRKAKNKRRVVRTTTVAVLWFVIFAIGAILNSEVLLWVAFTLSWGNLLYMNAVHERTLRKITGRQQPDYAAIRRMEKKLPPPLTAGPEEVE